MLKYAALNNKTKEKIIINLFHLQKAYPLQLVISHTMQINLQQNSAFGRKE